MKDKGEETIVLLAGGTGGHVFPAQIVGEGFEKKGIKVFLITDQRGVVYLKENSPFKIHVLKMQTGSFMKRLLGILKNTISVIKMLRYANPRLVVGFGGYPSAAGALAALFLRLPLCLHEQNAVLGRVNRFLAYFSKEIFLTFPKTQKLPPFLEKKIHIVGPLVRTQIHKIRKSYPYAASKGLKNQSSKFQILILGGSQGSVDITENILKSLSFLPSQIKKHLFLTFQVPKILIEKAQKELDQVGISHEVSSFFQDIPLYFSKTHLLVARSGSSTVGESLATGCPTIFIPLPSAMDNHQMLNASFVAEGKGGWVISQNSELPQKMASLIRYLFENPQELQEASRNLLKLYQEGAFEKIIGAVDLRLKGRHKETGSL